MVSMSSKTPAGHPSAPSAPHIDTEAAWKQVLARDTAATFFYAVTTTGIFCRPDCRSRRPLRANVRFFPTAESAIAAGFRPCRLCSPADPQRNPLEILRTHIEAHLDQRIRLAELGRLVKLSPFTVQRLFKRVMGVSPLAYQRALRTNSMRTRLRQGASVTEAIHAAGFGSSSRAYQNTPLGMTLSCFAKGGRGEHITYTTSPSPFGWILVASTVRGLCWLSLAGTKAEAEATLHAEFPAANLRRDPSLSRWVLAAVNSVCGSSDPAPNGTAENLDLRGTAFQLRVWQALRQIPRGETRTYSQLARDLGAPHSARAVARACATNRIALLVPCHRVVGAGGSLTGYRWGIERKRQLLDAETAGNYLGSGRKIAPKLKQ